MLNLLIALQLLNLLVLGHDTTACSLVWAVHCLSTHPAYQSRLRDEFRSLNKPVGAMSYTDLESLKFLNNFIREVLRLYCPGEPPEALCNFETES